MDTLPQETFDQVIGHLADACYRNKNNLLALRLVSRAFSSAIEKLACKTIIVDYVKLSEISQTRSTADHAALADMSKRGVILVLDMSLSRDKGRSTIQNRECFH